MCVLDYSCFCLAFILFYYLVLPCVLLFVQCPFFFFFFSSQLRLLNIYIPILRFLFPLRVAMASVELLQAKQKERERERGKEKPSHHCTSTFIQARATTIIYKTIQKQNRTKPNQNGNQEKKVREKSTALKGAIAHALSNQPIEAVYKYLLLSNQIVNSKLQIAVVAVAVVVVVYCSSALIMFSSMSVCMFLARARLTSGWGGGMTRCTNCLARIKR